MGPPPLFDQDFIDSEAGRLESSRNFCRSFLDKPGDLSRFEQEPQLAEALRRVQPFEVNQVVLARHPACGHLHYGLIFSKGKENNLMIKFLVPELGVQKVPDWQVSLELHEHGQDSALDAPGNSRLSSEARRLVSELDFKAAAFALQLLQYKSKLVHSQARGEGEAGWVKRTL